MAHLRSLCEPVQRSLPHFMSVLPCDSETAPCCVDQRMATGVWVLTLPGPIPIPMTNKRRLMPPIDLPMGFDMGGAFGLSVFCGAYQ